MKRFKKFLLDRYSRREPTGHIRGRRRAMLIVIIAALLLIFSVHAQSRMPYRFDLVPTSNTIAACLPDAAGGVTVLPKEDRRGVDTFDLKTEGLLPNTTFAVFLTELAEAPFGAAQYIGDFTTNADGRGSLRIDSIIEEAFSTTVVEGTRVRKELNHVVLWFADPAADDVCFAPATGPTTSFDGDGQAGGTALSSRNFLPDAPLP